MGGYKSALLFFSLLVTMMAAALVLGYYSYRATLQLAEKTELSIESSTRALGLKLVDRIEKVIIDTDRAFFRLVRLEDPREFRELWKRIVRVSPAVESVAVLDERRRLVHLVAQADRGEGRFLRKAFKTIIQGVDLDKLPLDNHRHLHRQYRGKYYLLSYIRQRSGSADYYVVLNINIPYVLSDVFPQEFGELGETNLISVTDAEGRALYGSASLPDDPFFLFESHFPTTLYKWRLRMAPRQLASLSREVKARRVSNVLLVGGAVGVIWIGLAVLLVAIRKERRANALKSEFIANVSHELKTPLSLIRMFAELLALGRIRDNATSQEYGEIITRESDRLTSLIDNVLDFARIERGKVAYEMAEGDLRAVVERALELCRYRIDQVDAHLVATYADPLPTSSFDETALTLLVLNLVENAVKYGLAAGGELRVSVGIDERGRNLVIRVADDGPGIPPEEARRIFDRFYRGRAARAASQRGSGIGLSLVKHIAEAHGGNVRLLRGLGKGATFEVSIPVRGAAPLV